MYESSLGTVLLKFNKFGRLFWTLLALSVCEGAVAQTACRVVAVADGDTLTALCQFEQVKVRLAEIDAPERGQAFGRRSRQSLAALCHGRSIVFSNERQDRYGRTVARVQCDGTDANAEQVRQGMAWVYDKYVKDRSLYELQDEARQAGRGLWRDDDPVAPWEWRRMKRERGVQ